MRDKPPLERRLALGKLVYVAKNYLLVLSAVMIEDEHGPKVTTG